MPIPKPDWLQANAERKWKKLIASDLKFRKENQKKREWNPNLSPIQIKTIDEAEDAYELSLVIRTIELNFNNIPPKDDRSIIPFQAPREVKEITTTEQPLNYVPDPSKNEEFSGYKYKTETKPAGYTLQPNEQLVSINEDKTLKVNVPEKQIINTITYEDALEVKDLSSYTQYLFKQQLLKHEFDPEPYVLPNNNIIETYQQFQWNVAKTNSADYVVKKTAKSAAGYSFLTKIKLTNLCSFVEKYLKQEPLSNQKRHLIEIFEKLKIDLISHKTDFWDRIKEYVEKPMPGVAPAPNLIPEVQTWLQEVRDFITARYAAYLYTEKDPITGKDYYPKCKNINFYLSDVEAIINNLKIKLVNVYCRLINNPILFKTNLKTTFHSGSTDFEEGGRGSGVSREKSAQKTLETEVEEIPLKTSFAENLGNYGNYKGQIFKNQATENTNENVRFDKEIRKEESKRSKTRGEKRDISRDVVLNSGILEFMGNEIEKLAIYDKIGEKLDKYFITDDYWEVKTLSELEEELEI